jgi:hypothetical protein
MKKVALALFCFIFLFSSQKTEATHVMGADITYKCIDSLKFEFTITYYRWCAGVSFSTPQTFIECSDGTNSRSITPTFVSIKEITPVCATASGECVPANTRVTGAEGIEQHTYKVVVDFKNAPYSSMVGCGKVMLRIGQCCRSSNINTGAANAPFQTYAEIDLGQSHCNSSPALTSEPTAILCCNQPVFYNIGALDLVDNDSLSYSWAHPKGSGLGNIGYSGTNYAYNHPFQVFYPGSTGPPLAIPNANPPVGIYLDPVTGDITFTPTRCDEITVAVIEVTEWRKDTAGIPRVVGSTLREMQFITKTCPDNNPPIINGPYTYNVCEGEQLCFDITTGDSTYVPPPPALSEPDTLQLSWNEGITGASFTILDTAARLKTGRFCWTPPQGSSSTKPYSFVTKIKDDACPLNSISYKAFSVIVKNKTSINLGKDTALCGGSITLSSTAAGNHLWNTGDTTSSISVDSTGLYVVSNNQACGSVDSIYVTIHESSNLNLGPDTTLCGDSLVLNAGIFEEYQWGDLSTSSSFVAYSSGEYYVEIKDTNGCTAVDSIQININKNLNTPVLTRVSNVIVSSISGTHQWFNDGMLIAGASDNFILISEIGNYTAIFLDSNGCSSDTSNLISKTLSVSLSSKSNLLLYPNPTDGAFAIDCKGLGEINRITLIDSQGKPLMISQYKKGNLLLIDYQSCSGILWLEILTNSGMYRQNIIHIQSDLD